MRQTGIRVWSATTTYIHRNRKREMSLPKHIHDAIFEYLEHMDGWTTPERGCEMAERILETKAKVCVDIGVFAARSTIAMGFAARQLIDSIVYGIDPWKID